MSQLPDRACAAKRAPGLAALRMVLLALTCLPSQGAAQLDDSARKEIEALLRSVGNSGCEFMRAGTAYTATKAQEHLQQKFAYLDSRGQLKSAEDFIVKAATRSSMTGEAYGIRCAGTDYQASDAWLYSRLKSMRPQGPALPKR